MAFAKKFKIYQNKLENYKFCSQNSRSLKCQWRRHSAPTPIPPCCLQCKAPMIIWDEDFEMGKPEVLLLFITGEREKQPTDIFMSHGVMLSWAVPSCRVCVLVMRWSRLEPPRRRKLPKCFPKMPPAPGVEMVVSLDDAVPMCIWGRGRWVGMTSTIYGDAGWIFFIGFRLRRGHYHRPASPLSPKSTQSRPRPAGAQEHHRLCLKYREPCCFCLSPTRRRCSKGSFCLLRWDSDEPFSKASFQDLKVPKAMSWEGPRRRGELHHALPASPSQAMTYFIERSDGKARQRTEERWCSWENAAFGRCFATFRGRMPSVLIFFCSTPLLISIFD